MRVKNVKIKKHALEKKYGTVVFLDYINHVKPENLNFIPVYFNDELKIKDCKQLTRKLMRKDILTTENDCIELTKKGISFIHRNEIYLKFFYLGSPYISLIEFEEMQKQNRAEQNSFEMTVISILFKKLGHYVKREESSHVIGIASTIGDMYEKEGDREQALEYYLMALYYQVAGIEFYDNFKKLNDGKLTEEVMKKSYRWTFVSHELLDNLKNYRDIKYDAMVSRIYDNRMTHIRLFSRGEFMNLVASIMDGEFNSAEFNKKRKKYYLELIIQTLKNKD